MNIDLTFLFASLAVFLFLGAVMMLVGIGLKQRELLPGVHADPAGYWGATIRYCIVGLTFSLLLFAGVVWEVMR